MDTSKYKVGDIVKFMGDQYSEEDRGEVVFAEGGRMKVKWEAANTIYEEDPYDDRIFLISRK